MGQGVVAVQGSFLSQNHKLVAQVGGTLEGFAASFGHPSSVSEDGDSLFYELPNEKQRVLVRLFGYETKKIGFLALTDGTLDASISRPGSCPTARTTGPEPPTARL